MNSNKLALIVTSCTLVTLGIFLAGGGFGSLSRQDYFLIAGIAAILAMSV